MPLLGAIPLNSGIMEGSELGKPVMITQPDSPSAEAFTVAAKNIAAQCSIQYYKMKEEAEAEAKWNGLSLEEKKERLSKHPILYEDLEQHTPEWENKTLAEFEQHIKLQIMYHLFGIDQYPPTPTTS